MKNMTWLTILLATLLTLGGCGDSGDGGGNNGANNGSNNGANPDAGDLDGGGTDADVTDAGNSDADNSDAGDADTAEEYDVDVGPLDRQTYHKKYVMALNRAICETAFNDCPNAPRLLSSGRRATSAEECIADVEAAIDRFSSTSEADEGTVFNEDAARDCLERIIGKQRADVCYTVSVADRAACEAAVTGTFADDEPCLSYNQCISGVCDYNYDPDNPDICWGTCIPAPHPMDEGKACGIDAVECDATQNLRCDVATDSDDRICVALGTRQQGDPCIYDDICVDGLVCDDGTCGVLEPGQVGDDCIAPPSNSTAASSKPCAHGLVCANLDANDNGTCAALGSEGDACSLTDQCQLGLYCDADAGSCVPTKAEGEECVDYQECGRHLTCMWDQGDVDTCQPIPEGQPACSLPD